MKALEIRYKGYAEKETIKFEHTAFEHRLGDNVLTKLKSNSMYMTIIAREDNVTEAGFNLVIDLYNANKGKLAKLGKERFRARVKLALYIATQIGKLSPENQILAYKQYQAKLIEQRNRILDLQLAKFILN